MMDLPIQIYVGEEKEKGGERGLILTFFVAFAVVIVVVVVVVFVFVVVVVVGRMEFSRI
jgi:hypothetical protein